MGAIKVFISYSNEDLERVKYLSKRLREGGVETYLDIYDPHPKEVWSVWIQEKIIKSDYIIVVCTEMYYKKVELKVNEEKGCGVIWESRIIFQMLYENRCKNEKIIPLIYGIKETEFIPIALKGISYYCMGEGDGYEKLYRHLTNQYDKVPALGSVKEMALKKSVYDLRAISDCVKENEVRQMLKTLGLYDMTWNRGGDGLNHEFYSECDGVVVYDLKTGLMWQQSGSEKNFLFKEAVEYIKQINRERFCGYNDWRMPTLEESMSLVERDANDINNMKLNSIFNARQKWIWTADKASEDMMWFVNYEEGLCNRDDKEYCKCFIRAVRKR